MRGSWATHRGDLVQVVRAEGGQSNHWGGSARRPSIWTLRRYSDGHTYTVQDPTADDLQPAQAPEGYQPPQARPEPLCGDQRPHTPHRVQVGNARSDCLGAW